jgi:hypothetical protein
VEQVAGIGWSGTSLADGTAAAYAAEVAQLAAAITAYRYAEGSLPSAGGGGRQQQGRRWGWRRHGFSLERLGVGLRLLKAYPRLRNRGRSWPEPQVTLRSTRSAGR